MYVNMSPPLFIHEVSFSGRGLGTDYLDRGVMVLFSTSDTFCYQYNCIVYSVLRGECVLAIRYELFALLRRTEKVTIKMNITAVIYVPYL